MVTAPQHTKELERQYLAIDKYKSAWAMLKAEINNLETLAELAGISVDMISLDLKGRSKIKKSMDNTARILGVYPLKLIEEDKT